MSTDLEKFIQRNREDFDQVQPAEKVWEKINTAYPGKKTRPYRTIYKWSMVAAAAFIFIASAYFLIKKYSHENNDGDTIAAEPPVEVHGITPEYAVEFKSVYQSVAAGQKELENAAASQPRLYQQFQQDLAVLDSSYQLLKNQAVQSVNRDVIIRAMIQNLQLQAKLLDRQLMIVNQFKNAKNLSHETIN